MRLFDAILTVVLAGTITVSLNAQERALDDLSAYYGFKDMEIIKLEWGIKDLRIADFNGDGRNDIAITDNQKARMNLSRLRRGLFNAST